VSFIRYCSPLCTVNVSGNSSPLFGSVSM
jgi:hypothetical protein